MPGGLVQVQAVGSADQYLVKDPQITLFKNVWRRYTNFALEQIAQTWTGDCDFGRNATVVLSKSGDLVSDCWLQVTLPDLSTVNHIHDAQKLPGAPSITRARTVVEDDIQVEAYGCGASAYVLSVRSDNTPVQSVTMTSDEILTLAFASSVSSVELVPLNGTTGTLAATTSGNTATVTGLVPDVTYGVSVNGSSTLTNHLLQLKETETTEDPWFEMTGANPAVPTYRAIVLARVDDDPTVSAEQIVMKARWCNEIGHALVSAVEWEMGGTRIDRHTPEHWSMWDELTESPGKREGYSEMVGRYEAYDINYDAKSFGKSRTLFVPLRFTFNTTPGNALPLLALQFHDCRLNFEFRAFRDLIKTNVPRLDLRTEPDLDATMYATYVFLSQDERKLYARMPHEYLIEQVQTQLEAVPSSQSVNATLTRKFTLTLSQPVKELMWVFQDAGGTVSDTVTGNNWFCYDIPGRESEEIFQFAKIQMNGHDRIAERPARYFRLAQPWIHHTRVPTKKVHSYSFSLHPEGTGNPSGAANFSRIDSAQLYVQFNTNITAGRLRIHAVSYNILRIAQGLSGVLFTT